MTDKDATNYNDMTKDELIDLADERGVDSSGTKADIIERLTANPTAINQPANETPFPQPVPGTVTTVGSTGAGQPDGSVVNTPDPGNNVYANIQGGANEVPEGAKQLDVDEGTQPENAPAKPDKG